VQVYETETKEVIRRFLAGNLTFPECIAALDAALAGLLPRLTDEDNTRLRIVMLANNEIVMREMQRRRETGEKRVTTNLFRDLDEAIKHSDKANNAFKAVLSNIPNGDPHPDGTQRIRNASSELTAAREATMKAHNRLTDFLNTGIVPDDLKHRG